MWAGLAALNRAGARKQRIWLGVGIGALVLLLIIVPAVTSSESAFTPASRLASSNADLGSEQKRTVTPPHPGLAEVQVSHRVSPP